MQLFDSHCHIHEIADKADGAVHGAWHKSGPITVDEVVGAANDAGVTGMLCVGTSADDSALAVKQAALRKDLWVSIGIHPHEAAHHGAEKLRQFRDLTTKPRVVAIGECGLDYFYTHSPPEMQKKILRFQLDIAKKHDLPVVFHVRDAFDDFWPIFDDYEGLRGVIHSFTAGKKELEAALIRGLYIGLNGIMTFTKEAEQLEAAKAVPLENLLLETDAPFLTPVPFRGTICQPKHVRTTAEFLSHLRGESLEKLARATTNNACTLLGIQV